MATTLTGRQCLRRQALGLEIDRVPTIGGWIGGAKVLSTLAGIGVDEYLANPALGARGAYEALGCDGLVFPIFPTAADQIRSGSVQEQGYAGIEPEALDEFARTLPDGEAGVLASFDAAKYQADMRRHFENLRRDYPGMEPVPNLWDSGGFPLYHRWGYVAFLSACALYPEAVDRIWWAHNVVAREKAKVLAGLYRELDLLPLMFCGEDVCNNQGPMVSPEFLREHYFPHVRTSIEPLLDAGVRMIHHCDGDVRQVVDDFLAIGFSGLQGFQYELGIDPYDLADKRDAQGRELLFFASMSVTYTLPFGTPQDLRDEVDWLHHWTAGGRNMFLFTSNVTGVEVPPENLLAGYRRAHDLKVTGAHPTERRSWPFQGRGR